MKKWLAAGCLCGVVWAAEPAAWELTQYADWMQGKMRNVSVTREGTVVPGPGVNASFALPEVSAWSMALAGDGTVYLGTGPRGRVYRKKPNERSLTSIATLPEGHVFALAVGPDGAVYAGGSPGGQVYRIGEAGAQVFGQTGAKMIWSLLATKEGVFAGTDGGRVYRLTTALSEIYYDSGQSNITTLAGGPGGVIYAGSDPNGILYKITAKEQAQVLYDAPFTEIRTILPRANGELWFLAMGGAAVKREQNLTQPAPATGGGTTPQVTTTITVTEEAQAGIDLKPKVAPATPATVPAATATTVSFDVPGLDRSAIYRLNADLTVDQAYVTKEETLYDLVERDGRVYFGTDRQGRIYRLEADRLATLLVETGEGEIGRLAPVREGWLAVATGGPKLLEVGREAKGPFEFESPVHEAKNVARWGALRLSGSGDSKLEARSGNTAKPDGTWSAWQGLEAGNVKSPAARYVQWRLRAEKDFLLRSATLHYLPQNQPPVVRSLSAVLTMTPSNSPRQQAATGASSTYTLTVTDTGEASSNASAGTASVLAVRPAGRQLTLSWVAEDPDSDVLQYELEFRAEEEREWKPLKREMTEAMHSIDADTLADGRYLFRVRASDELSNSRSTARTAVFESVPVLLDQTAPQVEARLEGDVLTIRARDEASPVRRVEYAVNAGRWVIVDAADGIYDSLEETARSEVKLGAGESIVTVRVFDAAMNVTLKKIVVRR